MPYANRIAFCQLMLDNEDRGLCTAFDCAKCMYLQEELKNVSHVGWECLRCLKETAGELRELPGMFNSGDDSDPDSPGLDGCTRCGSQSAFLQLVIR